MSEHLHTTCPSCHAVFRVKPAQLEAHGGKVRCGRCAYVFNAFDTLVSPIETVSLMAPPDDSPPSIVRTSDNGKEKIVVHDIAPMTITTGMHDFPLPTDEQIDEEAEAINREIAAHAHPELLEATVETLVKSTPRPAPKSSLKISPELHEKLNDLHQQLSKQEKNQRWQVVAWGLGSALLILVLVAQSAYFLRNTLAAYYPQTKPLLMQLCAPLNCRIELLANPDLIKLESSELQSVPDQTGVVALNASLRNLAHYPQAYPILELTLTDNLNQPVARRRFSPTEYLNPAQPPETGMPPREEVPIKLTLELVNLNAVGYRLLVFY